jgi:hypothetical protein
MIAPERLDQVARELEQALAATFGGEVVTKGESVLHRAIATAFDVVENARLKVAELASFVSLDPPRTGLPTGEEYLTDFATTIAETVALPASWRAPGDALTRLMVLPHEWTHVVQHQRGVNAGWWPKVTSHSVLYLASVATDDGAEYLGHVEADAYAVTECVRGWLSGGARRPIGDVCDNLRRHYAIKPAGADVAEATLRSHYATMDDGGVPNVTVCRWVIAWLDEHAADLRGQVIA